jgi:hypothetical protein
MHLIYVQGLLIFVSVTVITSITCTFGLSETCMEDHCKQMIQLSENDI